MKDNFITAIIDADRQRGATRVQTRFPPEPNGYLHIGHAKSICLNFGVAARYDGHCLLRFDDTNPEKESEEYARAIEEDVRWLGFEPNGQSHYASDYFARLHDYAVQLIKAGLAYVDDQDTEAVRATRGTLTEPGRESPCRNRSVAENLELFRRMREGEFAPGARVLRARIDMAAPNLHLRDPVIYRIRKEPHYRAGTSWCIFPMYDFTQCLSDALEGVSHSLCTLEFEDNRALYDWFLEKLAIPDQPRQIEFARLNLSATVVSKRLLARLVEGGHVSGWDDPRMPTLRGLRRRGCPPAAIREFCERIGLTRKDTTIDPRMLEHCIREHLDRHATRALAVLDPLPVLIENYPEGKTETLPIANHPADPARGTREVVFSRELYIEREDFMAAPPAGFHRLAPDREVRLRGAYLLRCTGIEHDTGNRITRIRARIDPDSRGGRAPDGRKVRGTLHWVSAPHAQDAEVRLYRPLFTHPDPASLGDDWLAALAPDSMTAVTAKLEPALAKAKPGDTFQFERLGYFCADPDTTTERPVFNRVVTLRDSWRPPPA